MIDLVETWKKFRLALNEHNIPYSNFYNTVILLLNHKDLSEIILQEAQGSPFDRFYWKTEKDSFTIRFVVNCESERFGMLRLLGVLQSKGLYELKEDTLKDALYYVTGLKRDYKPPYNGINPSTV